MFLDSLPVSNQLISLSYSFKRQIQSVYFCVNLMHIKEISKLTSSIIEAYNIVIIKITSCCNHVPRSVFFFFF